MKKYRDIVFNDDDDGQPEKPTKPGGGN